MTVRRWPGAEDETHVRYGQVDRGFVRRLATTAPEADGPVWMVNLIRYREQAVYADGRPTELSGRQADDRYSPVDVLADIGAEPVLVADVDAQLLGDRPAWDRVGVVRYPTRRAFVEMQSRPDFQAEHEHKDAGVAETIVCACVPIPSPMDEIDVGSLPSWSGVPHPPTDDDGPVVVLHLIRFHPGMAATEMVAYQHEAIVRAQPHGARIAGWFGVEGTVVGDGRQWDQARFNAFPSRAAFMAVVIDPARLEAQRSHREVAIADTYTMILRPTIDHMAASLAS